MSNSLFDFTKSTNPVKTILWSGFIVGILDALAGVIAFFIFLGLNPFQVLKFIASGFHGPEAMNGGFLMVMAGNLYHFMISYIVAIIYFFLFPRMEILREKIVLMGLIYGLGIWLVMNLIVTPLSNVPQGPFNLGLTIVGIVWHMVLVGLPIAIITSKYTPEK